MSAPYRSWPGGIGQGGARPYDPADLIEVDDEASLPTVPPLAALPVESLAVDPVTGYILAPLLTGEDGKATLALDALPRGTAHGVIEVADAPQGARNATAKIDGNWIWRLVSGEGWAVRQGKGPERANGTRPKLAILEPCASVTLRAVGVDEAFPDTTHHAVLAWVQITRTGSWKAEAGWLGSTEQIYGMCSGRPIRRGWTAGPRRIGVTACKAVLAVPPDSRVIETALAAAVVPDSDQDVSA